MNAAARVVAASALTAALAACADYESEQSKTSLRASADATESEGADGGARPAAPGADAAAAGASAGDAWGGPYTLITPGEESSDHLGAEHLGDDCMSCHTGAGAPRFALAGTVFTTRAAKDGAARVQVRVVDPSGNEVALVGTDSSGNFWLRDAPDLPPGSRVALRDDLTTRAMNASVAGAVSCNQAACHSAARPLHLHD